MLECHYGHVENEVTDCVVSYAILAAHCMHLCADQMTFDLALLQLVREGRCSMLHGDAGEKVGISDVDAMDYQWFQSSN